MCGTRNVTGLGRRGDVTAANPGWVRHKLFPDGAVVYATPNNVKHFAMAEEERARLTSPEELERERLFKILRRLAKDTVRLSRRKIAAAEGGQDVMVGSITAFDIQNAVARQMGIQLHDSHFLMETPIDEFGVYKVPLNLRQRDDTQLELNVQVNAVSRLHHGNASC
ncbi:hypothetical protein DUNSADRAFT_16450 [Dunaliella salina]|uniref:Large ribosomal subunit protein bL9c n=1 Tax=Dunaliella salina TaxID=3046 RepID=A0ABQ7H0Y0_DUNSA|nr:hypothetical protein DUNSADRAFT_16450 [Dunaliella salina]|eukprot:KAF5840509.1 hypothetical protein DUNSADRAFT_16450 [Dunaliella salina]